MKIALGQINPIIGDIEGNKAKIIEYYRKALEDKADLIIFPELALPGYPPLDLIEKKEFREEINRANQFLASISGKTAILFGSITEECESVGTGIYNSALLCYDSQIQFVQKKTLIPNYDVFDEVRYFEPAKEVGVFNFRDEVLGISVCEDIWNDADYWKHRRYSFDPMEILKQKGATLYINISASPYAFGKRQQRKEMLSVLAKNDNKKLIYACCTGAQTDLIFDGGSMYINQNGDVLKLGKVFEEDYIFFNTTENYPEINKVELSYSEEVLPALICGLRDYAQKTGFKKAVLGLSGGIDSALVTYIAVKALGSENVEVILMPSEYSSAGSIVDSVKLCKNLNVKYWEIGIQSVFENIKTQLQPVFSGRKEDLTEENMQSRIRGLFLMAVSNKTGALLCTTGNKSEMAVGYATLYGDMNGALAVIGDVYKTRVYDICNFINREGEIIPQEIITKAPSAELRHNQTDQDSLPEYDVLDKILELYLEENKEYKEIIELIGSDFAETIKKTLRLVDLNEFKRKQSAPVLRVTKKAFGYGRRFPVVQGWTKNYRS